jgi:transcriptional regulator with XRE-family HTH domain
MAFGDRLELELERRGFTQRELARRLDVSPQAVNGWMRGTSQPSWERLVKLEDVLDLPRGELMALLGYRPPPDGDERLVTLEEAIRADEGISPESKRALLRFVRLARAEAAAEG